ncbi:MAG: RNA polymerase sigma factor [Lachnospiraceae bacterium]|nr:RNA polymerase sigma factor [Lachnospiraceae bacterium]
MQQDINSLLQAIYDDYQKPLRILALAIGVPAKDVDDVVQETVISYYEHYPLDWTPGHKKSMLSTILRNKSIDYFRKNQREWLILDSEEFGEDPNMALLYGRDLLEQIIKEEINRDVNAASEQLKEDMRITAQLHLIEGIPEKEVAKMLGITAVACRARISRARKILKSILGPKYGF